MNVTHEQGPTFVPPARTPVPRPAPAATALPFVEEAETVDDGHPELASTREEDCLGGSGDNGPGPFRGEEVVGDTDASDAIGTVVEPTHEEELAMGIPSTAGPDAAARLIDGPGGGDDAFGTDAGPIAVDEGDGHLIGARRTPLLNVETDPASADDGSASCDNAIVAPAAMISSDDGVDGREHHDDDDWKLEPDVGAVVSSHRAREDEVSDIDETQQGEATGVFDTTICRDDRHYAEDVEPQSAHLRCATDEGDNSAVPVGHRSNPPVDRSTVKYGSGQGTCDSKAVEGGGTLQHGPHSSGRDLHTVTPDLLELIGTKSTDNEGLWPPTARIDPSGGGDSFKRANPGANEGSARLEGELEVGHARGGYPLADAAMGNLQRVGGRAGPATFGEVECDVYASLESASQVRRLAGEGTLGTDADHQRVCVSSQDDEILVSNDDSWEPYSSFPMRFRDVVEDPMLEGPQTSPERQCIVVAPCEPPERLTSLSSEKSAREAVETTTQTTATGSQSRTTELSMGVGEDTPSDLVRLRGTDDESSTVRYPSLDNDLLHSDVFSSPFISNKVERSHDTCRPFHMEEVSIPYKDVTQTSSTTIPAFGEQGKTASIVKRYESDREEFGPEKLSVFHEEDVGTIHCVAMKSTSLEVPSKSPYGPLSQRDGQHDTGGNRFGSAIRCQELVSVGDPKVLPDSHVDEYGSSAKSEASNCPVQPGAVAVRGPGASSLESYIETGTGTLSPDTRQASIVMATLVMPEIPEVSNQPPQQGECRLGDGGEMFPGDHQIEPEHVAIAKKVSPWSIYVARRNIHCGFIACSAFVLIGIILAVTLPLTLRDGTTHIPTAAPTLVEDRLSPIREILTTVSGSDVLADSSSKHYEAMMWIAEEDELRVPTNDVRWIVQRYVLALLYFSTGGPNWSVQFNFLSKEHECKWNGRTKKINNPQFNGVDDCIQDLWVNHLSLENNNLNGTIPSEIALLTELQFLVLYNNSLSGTIPSLKSLRNLAELNIWGNELTGSIFSEIGAMTALKTLSLRSNNLTGPVPESIGNLTSLETMKVNENVLTGPIPSSIGSLLNLKYMYLNNNSLTGQMPSSIGFLVNLTRLYLHNNDLTGSIPYEFGLLADVEYLILTNNSIGGSLPDSLGTLTELKHLWVNNNGITGTIPQSFVNLTGAESIRLHQNNITSDASFMCELIIRTIEIDCDKVNCACRQCICHDPQDARRNKQHILPNW